MPADSYSLLLTEERMVLCCKNIKLVLLNLAVKMYSTAFILGNIIYSWSSHQVKFFFPHVVLDNCHVCNLSHVVSPMWEALVICLSIFGTSTPERSLIRSTLLCVVISISHSFSIFTYTYIDFVSVSDTKHVTLQSVVSICVLLFHQYFLPNGFSFLEHFRVTVKLNGECRKFPYIPSPTSDYTQFEGFHNLQNWKYFLAYSTVVDMQLMLSMTAEGIKCSLISYGIFKNLFRKMITLECL